MRTPPGTAVSPALELTKGRVSFQSLAYMRAAMRSCLWLLRQATRWDCSLARLRAGRRMLISRAMMPMTTSSSTSVKPRRGDRGSDMLKSRLGGCGCVHDGQRTRLLWPVKLCFGDPERQRESDGFLAKTGGICLTCRRLGGGFDMFLSRGGG